jgi:hypothetical protein
MTVLLEARQGDAAASGQGRADRMSARRPPGSRSSPARQRRLPWIALGLLLVFGAGLAFVAWTRAASAQVAVLVAARDIAPGDVVPRSALRVERVTAGAKIASTTTARQELVVGMRARGFIPAGTLVNAAMVSDAEVVPAGQAVVGAVLPPGAYPIPSLHVGDPVDLVSAASTGDPAASVEALGSGRVWAITDVGTPGTAGRFVSVLVPADRAAAITNAAAQQRLRLVLVGRVR